MFDGPAREADGEASQVPNPRENQFKKDAGRALLEPLEARRLGLRRPDLVRNSFKLELIIRQPGFVRRDFVRRAALDGRQPPEMFLDLLEIRLRREAAAHLRDDLL